MNVAQEKLAQQSMENTGVQLTARQSAKTMKGLRRFTVAVAFAAPIGLAAAACGANSAASDVNPNMGGLTLVTETPTTLEAPITSQTPVQPEVPALTGLSDPCHTLTAAVLNRLVNNNTHTSTCTSDGTWFNPGTTSQANLEYDFDGSGPDYTTDINLINDFDSQNQTSYFSELVTGANPGNTLVRYGNVGSYAVTCLFETDSQEAYCHYGQNGTGGLDIHIKTTYTEGDSLGMVGMANQDLEIATEGVMPAFTPGTVGSE